MNNEKTGVQAIDFLLFCLWAISWITGTTIEAAKNMDIILSVFVKLWQIGSFTLGGIAAIASFHPGAKNWLSSLGRRKKK